MAGIVCNIGVANDFLSKLFNFITLLHFPDFGWLSKMCDDGMQKGQFIGSMKSVLSISIKREFLNI